MSPVVDRFALAPLADALHHAVVAVAKSWARAWTTRRNRRAVVTLLDLDDRMLADIGLRRGDVVAVLAGSGHDDPSTRLRILSVERRAGRRAMQREALAAMTPASALPPPMSTPAASRPAPQGSVA